MVLNVLRLAGLLLLVSACGKKPCKLNSDCSTAERCVASYCEVLCRVDRDCQSTQRCVEGECTFNGSTGGGFVIFGGGMGGGAMAGGSAGGMAGGSAGGAAGGVAGGVAGGAAGGVAGGAAGGVAGGLAGGAAGGSGGGAGGGSAGGTAGGNAGGATAGGAPDAGNRMGQRGDPCTRASDCMSNLCIGNPMTGTGACTESCVTEATCQPREACLQIPNPGGGTTGVCVPTDTGTACPTGQPTNCVAGICIVHPGNTSLSVCTTPCLSSRACPMGFSCSLTQIGASTQQVCTPNGSLCSARGNSTQCHSRWCTTPPSMPSTGICTSQCSVATDCPDGWVCGIDNGPGGMGVVDRCFPAGMSCTENMAGQNDCISQTCVIGSPTGNYCTSFCMGPGGTAAPSRCPLGWMCVNEGSMTQPLWVCER